MGGRTTTETLIYMANQIARNMHTMNDANTAAAIADHIKSFWDPRMLAGIRAADQSLLLPITREALALVYGPVPHQTQATQFAGPNGTGHSDAG